jgi:hypothetical protein
MPGFLLKAGMTQNAADDPSLEGSQRAEVEGKQTQQMQV